MPRWVADDTKLFQPRKKVPHKGGAPKKGEPLRERVFPHVSTHRYPLDWTEREKFQKVPASALPAGVKWKPPKGRQDGRFTTLTSIGDLYRLLRDRETGDVVYYKRIDSHADLVTPAEVLDAEPKPRKLGLVRVGGVAWFIDDAGFWYCVDVVARAPGKSVTIRSRTGWDADRVRAWPYPELLEIDDRQHSFLKKRLLPFKARPL